ncbi:MAG: DUF4395 domain-containing protein [Anaerolineaceae bacterium]
MRSLFTFPDPVNEISARLVAGGVAAMTALFLITGNEWLLLVIAYGFLARVLAGPKISPLGLLVTRVVEPALSIKPRLTPGPPKRFAQGIGATLSIAAGLSYFLLSLTPMAYVLVAAILVAASLEAFVGFCLGCTIFGLLMRMGVIPDSVCEACGDISHRRPSAAAAR